MCSTSKIHAFEKAGLGLAPFKCVGVTHSVGPIRMVGKDGIEISVGSPGQPMGCCDFCGTGIAYIYHIRSADGKAFKVGCECVKKTGDAGLVAVADREQKRINRELRHAREAAVIAGLNTLLEDKAVWARLESMPHPFNWVGKTAADYVRFMVRNSGNSGKVKLAKWLKTHGVA
jgi:hypothetical protein